MTPNFEEMAGDVVDELQTSFCLDLLKQERQEWVQIIASTLRRVHDEALESAARVANKHNLCTGQMGGCDTPKRIAAAIRRAMKVGK